MLLFVIFLSTVHLHGMVSLTLFIKKIKEDLYFFTIASSLCQRQMLSLYDTCAAGPAFVPCPGWIRWFKRALLVCRGSSAADKISLSSVRDPVSNVDLLKKPGREQSRPLCIKCKQTLLKNIIRVLMYRPRVITSQIRWCNHHVGSYIYTLWVCNYPESYLLICCRIRRAPGHFVTSACLRCATAWMLSAARRQTAPCASNGPHCSRRSWPTSCCIWWQLQVGQESRKRSQKVTKYGQSVQCQDVIIQCPVGFIRSAH